MTAAWKNVNFFRVAFGYFLVLFDWVFLESGAGFRPLIRRHP